MTRQRRRFLLLLAGGSILLPAWGQDSAAVDELRKEVASLRQLLNERLTPVASNVQIHGFVSQGWMHTTRNNWLTDSSDGSFELTEVGLNAMANLTDDLRAGVQLLGYDLGEAGNLKVKIDWAYGDYNVAEWLGVRAGRVKMPMGQYNETRDTDALRVPVLLPQSVYPEIYRDLMLAVNGVDLYGHLRLGPVGGLAYQAWIGGMDLDSEDAGLRRQMTATGLYTVNDLDVRYVMGGALDYETPLPGLRLTGSHLRMKDFRSDLTTTIAGNFALGYVDVSGVPPIPEPLPPQELQTNTADYWVNHFGCEYTYDRLTLAAERQQHGGANYITLPAVTTPSGTDIPARLLRRPNHQLGYYGMAHYEVVRDHLWLGGSYGRFFVDGTDQHGADYAAIGLPDYLGWQKDTGVFLRYDVTRHCSLKLEHHWLNGAAQVLTDENEDAHGNLDTSRSWKALLLKTSFYF